MPMMILTVVISCAVQLAVLFAPEKPGRYLRFSVSVLLTGLPLAGAAWYAAARPADGLGWAFGAAMCLWLAGAAAVGCALAWGLWAAMRRRGKTSAPKGETE